MINVAGIINIIQMWLVFALVAVVVGMSAFSLIHALTTPAQAFTSEGKRTRNFWVLLNLLALVISFLALTPTGPVGLFGALMALIIPGVYLADVRPAVAYWRRRGRGSGSGSGGNRPPTPW
ncbi:MAG: DUF2516 family protein [Mobiluncus porci]|uniref:DUF2516 family protein n=1 Tax=Mobiluncus porci TaxID=2652278 RepID=A0A7K0K5F1_9ACTO|nr:MULTISPECIES: DUF2516 family protein [Mobiluncus]MCI6584650.1 DUF2516 family protein [Mobiluncus sp.]MDD7542464.1 DUF2516 family protein [Mobiluncus porci]MDY5747884.1 DUF2516 family protein [Mobiluncus porci]MST50674.1 DUF2516 family protein [Mobiluncus porci]